MEQRNALPLPPLDNDGIIRLDGQFPKGQGTELLSPEVEYQMRLDFAGTFTRMVRERRTLEQLATAIGHAQEAKDRTTPGALEMPERVDSIAHLYFLKYTVTEAIDDINQAVNLGRLARIGALFRQFEDHHPLRLLTIIHTLGSALHNRYRVTSSEEDLAEAVALGRNALSIVSAHQQPHQQHQQQTSSPNDAYSMALVNLAFRVSSLFKRTRKRADFEEAVRLLDELLDRGFRDMAGVLAQRSDLLFIRWMEKCTKTGTERPASPELLDKAILRCCEALAVVEACFPQRPSPSLSSNSSSGSSSANLSKASLSSPNSSRLSSSPSYPRLSNSMPNSGTPPRESILVQRRTACLGNLANMHSLRFQRSDKVEDIQTAVKYSNARFSSSTATFNDHVVRHITYAVRYARALTKAELVKQQITECTSYANRLPDDHIHKEACMWMLGDLICRQYELSGKLEDLLEFLWHSRSLAQRHNSKTRVGTGPGHRVDVDSIDWLLSDILSFKGATNHSRAKKTAVMKLPGYFRAACARARGGVNNACFVLWSMQGKRLGTYSRLATSQDLDIDISPEDLEVLVRDSGGDEYHSSTEGLGVIGQHWSLPQGYRPGIGMKQIGHDDASGLPLIELPPLGAKLLAQLKCQTRSMQMTYQQELTLEQDARECDRNAGLFPNPGLCRICRGLKLLKPRPDKDRGGYVWNDEIKGVSMGTFTSLMARMPCIICRLIMSLATDDSGVKLHRLLTNEDADADTRGHGGSECFIVEVVKPTSGGQAVLKVEYSKRALGAVRVIDDTDKSWTGVRQGYEVTSRDGRTGAALDDRDGVVRGQAGQKFDTQVFKRWISHCEKHGKACNPSWKTGRFSTPVATTLLDVRRNCLVAQTTACSYFALSYVHGPVSDQRTAPTDGDQTVFANHSARCVQDGVKVESLPSTIRQAIELVRKMDGQYLWVDHLCFDHDSNGAKRYNAERMDIIFAHAQATIVALEGNDANAGLFGFMGGTRPTQFMPKVYITGHTADLRYDPLSSDRKALRLTATQKALGLVVDNSAWNNSARVVQEHVFSRRCLFLSKEGVYFRCQRGVKDETSSGLSPLLNPVHQALDNPVLALNRIRQPSGRSACRKALAAYTWMVEECTARSLLSEADILRAHTGFGVFLSRAISTQVISGMPARLIGLALLWTAAATTAVKPRDVAIVGALQTLDGPMMALQTFNGQMTELLTMPEAMASMSYTPASSCPSWSWASVTGPIEYRVFSPEDEKRPLPSLLVDHFHLLDRTGREMPCVYAHETATARCLNDRLAQLSYDDMAQLLALHNGQNVLHFITHGVPTNVFTPGADAEFLRRQDGRHARAGQGHARVYRLFDGRNIHCGLLFGMSLDDDELSEWPMSYMVAIARHIDVDVPYGPLLRAEEDGDTDMADADVDAMDIDQDDREDDDDDGAHDVDVDDTKIPLFDGKAYPKTGSGSALIDVLVIGPQDCQGVSRRMGVAKIHEKAWLATPAANMKVRLV